MDGRQVFKEALDALLGVDDWEEQVKVLVEEARVALLDEGAPASLVQAALDSIVSSVRGTVRPIADPQVRRAAFLDLLASRLEQGAARRYVREYRASVPQMVEHYADSPKYLGLGVRPGPQTTTAYNRQVERLTGPTPGE